MIVHVHVYGYQFLQSTALKNVNDKYRWFILNLQKIQARI